MSDSPAPATRKAWDPSTMGFGKHDYKKIDPSTINPDEYARNLRGEEAHFGDVREYNSAYNDKHPENTLEIDWLARLGTVFLTDAPGFEGTWVVVLMPVVRTPQTFCRVAPAESAEGAWFPTTDEITEIPIHELGVAADPANNLYKQVKSVLVYKGRVDRTQRERLTKRS